jgi:hypothetical protein
MTTDDEWAAIEQVVTRLCARFADVQPDAVAGLVRDIHADFDGRPIRGYIPVLVEHRAHDLLRGMSRDVAVSA